MVGGAGSGGRLVYAEQGLQHTAGGVVVLGHERAGEVTEGHVGHAPSVVTCAADVDVGQ